MSDDLEETLVLGKEAGTLSVADALKLLITFQWQNLHETY